MHVQIVTGDIAVTVRDHVLARLGTSALIPGHVALHRITDE
jgi:hypothetical protein